jgi:hypothetical protein
MDHALETGVVRVSDHLRRPLPGRRKLLTETAGNTISETDPVAASSGHQCHYEALTIVDFIDGAAQSGAVNFTGLLRRS